ncbi:MAG: hypothetical protein HFI44_15935 [Lachnospiraceae bacterium]|nr:hypothetical protein [Lachnospiraceae bacterium]GFI04813.1 putative methyl-accepting chemotaxis protein YoaH [Lachnospiraceae bacterium]
MKLRTRLLIMALLPVIALGIFAYIAVSVQLRNGIEKEAFEGMQTATWVVRELFDSTSEGEYYMDTEGQVWKGEGLNISKATEIVDTIKAETGCDVTVFYGDERVLTTLVDSGGNRQVGTKASAEVISQVLDKGQEYGNSNAQIFGKRYICYYIPLYQENTKTPVGMVFLGKEYTQIQTTIRNSLVTMLLIILVVLVIVSITSVLGATSIAAAIKGAIGYVDQMRQGELGIKASPKMIGRKDEIGDMCRGMKELDDNLSAIVTEIQTQAQILGETSTTCNSNAHKTLESAEQVNAAAEEIASATMTQAQGAVAAETSVNVIGKTIAGANAQIQEFSDLSRKMAQASGGAAKTLTDLNQSMKQVKGAVDTIQHQTNETHGSVEKIGEMTEMITSIATQTNLLSLNASIEAARAGEMGKGFAVVAEEIRKLAEQCNTSAVEIQEVLAQLRNNSDESVKTMEGVQKIIQVQADKLEETNREFSTVEGGINQSVQGLSEIMKEMNGLDKERAQTVEEVQNVAALAQQNAASIEETAASIDEMVHLISTMSERIENLQQVADALKEKASVFHFS